MKKARQVRGFCRCFETGVGWGSGSCDAGGPSTPDIFLFVCLGLVDSVWEITISS